MLTTQGKLMLEGTLNVGIPSATNIGRVEFIGQSGWWVAKLSGHTTALDGRWATPLEAVHELLQAYQQTKLRRIESLHAEIQQCKDQIEETDRVIAEVGTTLKGLTTYMEATAN